MNTANHPWELIFRKDGRVFSEPFPGFQVVAREFSEHPCHNILDLGCGNGRHVVALKKLGLEVTGLDISVSGLRLTGAWLEEQGQQAGLVQADMRQSFPFKAGSFDGLLSTQVIHHALLAEVRGTIVEIGRVLSKGAIAFVTLAGSLDQETEYKEIENGTYIPLEGTEMGLPHHIFSEHELLQEFKAFRIREFRRAAEGRVLTLWLEKG
jgi:SAM-dependent methyltransferase